MSEQQSFSSTTATAANGQNVRVLYSVNQGRELKVRVELDSETQRALRVIATSLDWILYVGIALCLIQCA